MKSQLFFEKELKPNGCYSFKAVALINGIRYESKAENYTDKTQVFLPSTCIISLSFNIVAKMYNQRVYAIENARSRFGISAEKLNVLEKVAQWLDANNKGHVDIQVFNKNLIRILPDLYAIKPSEESPFHHSYIAKYVFLGDVVLECADIKSINSRFPINVTYPKPVQMALEF